MKRRRIFSRYGPTEDIERELRSHIELRTDELVAAGWDPVAAREEALRLFGDPDKVAAQCQHITESQRRAEGRTRMMQSLWGDISYGIRGLKRSPGFTFVAVITLALGIGANTAIFSVVNGVLLQPLPFEDPEEIVWVSEANNRGGTMRVAWMNYRDWRDQLTSFEAIGAYSVGSSLVLGGREPEQAIVANITEDFWEVFGVVPQQGRLTQGSDHVEGTAPAVVVSRDYWETRLDSRPVAGTLLDVGSSRAEVVGVVDDVGFPDGVDVWVPAELGGFSTSRTSHNWRVVGRIQDGVTLERARQEVDALTRTIVLDEAGADPNFLATGAVTVPLQERIVGGSRQTLLLMLGAAGLVLLVACTNLASTLLARGTARAREISVRSALGAPKLRIVRQLLTESVVIAALGAAAGVGVAVLVTRALQTFGGAAVPRLAEVGTDGWVLAYTGALALGTAFLFGSIPAFRLTSSGPGGALQSGSRGSSAEGRGIWSALVITEVALALVLLVGTGLLVRSSQALLAEDIGVDASDVNTAAVSLSRIKYESEYDHARWYDQLFEQLEARGEVSAAGVISTLPAAGSIPNGRMEYDGDLDNSVIAWYVIASGGAFDALDVPILQGRTFDRRDTPESEHVAIVNRTFVEEVWPEVDPIGRSVTGGGMDNFWEDRTFARVVGVVDDVRYHDLSRPSEPTIYFPHSQRPLRLQWGASVVVESAQGSAPAVAGLLRQSISSLDSDVPIRLRTMEDHVRESIASRRFSLLLLSGFSLLGLVLATIGIYGVVSYGVARRSREVGIRLALGATGRQVLRMVIASSMRTVVFGLAVGIAAALVATRLLVDQLYGVTPTDPVTLVAVVVLLAATAFFASWIPARRGARVDPMITMRAE